MLPLKVPPDQGARTGQLICPLPLRRNLQAPSRDMLSVQTLRSILGALGIVAVIFGVPVLATLMAGKIGYSAPIIGWFTLLAMMVLAFRFRATLGLLAGERRLAAVRSRRIRKG